MFMQVKPTRLKIDLEMKVHVCFINVKPELFVIILINYIYGNGIPRSYKTVTHISYLKILFFIDLRFITITN